MTVRIPCGDSALTVHIRGGVLMGILENRERPPANVRKLVLKSLRQKRLPFGRKKVLIVVPDATRSAHLKEILPILLDRISMPSRTIDIMIATGLHKAHSYNQIKNLLGPFVLKRCKVMQHDAFKGPVMNFGQTVYGVPATLNRKIRDYDYIISVGVIEPHLYAGYSGGAKTIAIGLAGQDTVNATHSVRFLDAPSVTIGSVKGNIFQETLWHIMENAGPVFSINTVNNSGGKALKIFSGPADDVFHKGCEFARTVFEIGVKEGSDIAICGIGRPKDVNLYQASRAINYVLSVDSPVVRKGGVVIIAAELRDGMGEGAAEKRFYQELKNMRSSSDFVKRIKIDGCVAGEHRAYMVAKALLDYNVIFVTKSNKSFMNGLPFRCFCDISEALQFARTLTGPNPKIYVIPRALAAIARLDSA